MTFRIRAIHLYGSKVEKIRSIEFRPHGLNIITGESATGKSAVIDIIDYCLASNGFSVPTGVIRESVRTYALIIETRQGLYICARDAPARGRNTTTTMYIGVCPDTEPPDVNTLRSNMDLTAARRQLSTLTGIEENITDARGGSRAEFSANIRHSLYFVLQGQGEVANPNILFHSQNEEWAPQAIRDVLPYFLGAVDPEFIRKQALLRSIRRELRLLSRQLSEDDEIVAPTGRSAALVAECQSVGLLPADQSYTTEADALAAIRRVLDSPLDDAFANDDIPNVVEVLISRRQELRSQLGEARSELENLRALLAAHQEFGTEAVEQSARLQTVRLLRRHSDGETNVCPVCQSNLEEPVTSVDEIERQLALLDDQISSVRQNAPNLQALIGQTENQIGDINGQLRLNQAELDDVLSTQESLAQARDLALNRANTRGRISLYLESVYTRSDSQSARDRVESLRQQEQSLLDDLDENEVRSRLESALARVSLHMADVAEALQLEYAGIPVRLDISKLTVVVDTESGPARLTEIGSGENWLGYHLATLLGLHRYFREQDRPVPRMLVLDQPSQVYYPQDPISDDVPVSDEDRLAVERIFRYLYDRAADPSEIQIIVLDHADVSRQWFQTSIVERWRYGPKLIPADWLE